MLLGALVLATTLLGCSAAPDPARVQTDPRLDAAYVRWLEAGEPRLQTSGDDALVGKASWYGPGLDGNATASGERFDMHALTAAHRSLPFDTIVRVRRLDTRQFVIVRINDRGPFVKGRIVDLSYGAAYELGMVERGVVEVEIDVVALPANARADS